MNNSPEKLLTISLAKLATSRSVKGGMKLHKTLLLSQVMERARTAYISHHPQIDQPPPHETNTCELSKSHETSIRDADEIMEEDSSAANLVKNDAFIHTAQEHAADELADELRNTNLIITQVDAEPVMDIPEPDGDDDINQIDDLSVTNLPRDKLHITKQDELPSNTFIQNISVIKPITTTGIPDTCEKSVGGLADDVSSSCEPSYFQQSESEQISSSSCDQVVPMSSPRKRRHAQRHSKQSDHTQASAKYSKAEIDLTTTIADTINTNNNQSNEGFLVNLASSAMENGYSRSITITS